MSAYGQRMDPITDAERQHALAERLWVTGIAFESDGQRLFLKCAFHTGHTQTVILDPPRTADLFWYLRRLLHNRPKNVGSPATLPVDAKGVSVGRWFPAEDQS